MPPKDEISSDEFDEILIRIVDQEPGETLIQIPGVYEVLSEYYNNEVIDWWRDRKNEEES